MIRSAALAFQFVVLLGGDAANIPDAFMSFLFNLLPMLLLLFAQETV